MRKKIINAQPSWYAANRCLVGSAGFLTCRIADFQIGNAEEFVRSADLEIRDTADLEVCATRKPWWLALLSPEFMAIWF